MIKMLRKLNYGMELCETGSTNGAIRKVLGLRDKVMFGTHVVIPPCFGTEPLRTFVAEKLDCATIRFAVLISASIC